MIICKGSDSNQQKKPVSQGCNYFQRIHVEGSIVACARNLHAKKNPGKRAQELWYKISVSKSQQITVPDQYGEDNTVPPHHNPLLINTHVNNRQLLKTLWEKEKLLVTSNFSFCHNVFYSIRYVFYSFRYLYPHLSIFLTSYLYLQRMNGKDLLQDPFCILQYNLYSETTQGR